MINLKQLLTPFNMQNQKLIEAIKAFTGDIFTDDEILEKYNNLNEDKKIVLNTLIDSKTK